MAVVDLFPGTLAAALAVACLLCGCGGAQEPAAAGDHRLPPCPGTPNCVSSLGAGRQRVDPLPFTGDAQRVIEVIAGHVVSRPRTAVVSRSADTLHVTFRSRLGFVDDVHFLVDSGGSVVHVRSASRTGSWDLGVNRRRVESLRRSLAGKI